MNKSHLIFVSAVALAHASSSLCMDDRADNFTQQVHKTLEGQKAKKIAQECIRNYTNNYETLDACLRKDWFNDKQTYLNIWDAQNMAHKSNNQTLKDDLRQILFNAQDFDRRKGWTIFLGGTLLAFTAVPAIFDYALSTEKK